MSQHYAEICEYRCTYSNVVVSASQCYEIHASGLLMREKPTTVEAAGRCEKVDVTIRVSSFSTHSLCAAQERAHPMDTIELWVPGGVAGGAAVCATYAVLFVGLLYCGDLSLSVA